ncbi:MAG: hypothetical protein GY856_23905 [bacterium]|nr:hypothetical protein [bacterium]
MTFDEAGAHCAAATPVDVNSSLRIPGNEGTAARTFEIEVPFPGILTLDVAVRGSAPVEPKLDFLGRNCAGPAAEGAAFATIKRSAASLVLTVRVPGSYLFRIAGQDPLLPLEEYKLITGFLAESVDDEGLFGLKDEDPSEDEPEPDPQPFVGPRQNPAAGFGLKDEDPSEDEPEPDPQPAPYYDLSHGSAALRSKLAAVCRSGEIDDHGDTFNCATAFCPGLEVAGEIRNGWGDDHDLFMFVLTEPQTIAVETTGFTDTFGGLYDRYGHRLGRADDGGSGDNFRIAKTLSPGIYFVRAEGCDGAEGCYTLTVKTLN